MTAFTPVSTTKLAVTTVNATLDLSQLAGFQNVELSGNLPTGVTAYRRPNMVRLTYFPSVGANACFVTFGATAPTATSSSETIISAWPLQRTLRFTENFIAAITASAGDTGTLQIEVGFGDPV